MVGENSAIRQNTTKFNQITDGTVDTISIAIGSRKQAVPWTKPVDMQGTPVEIAAKMLTENPDGFWAATCDIAVHFITPKTDREKLAWAIQINDGNLLSPHGDELGEALAGPNVPNPMYDPTEIIPGWWTDYLIPLPWTGSASTSK